MGTYPNDRVFNPTVRSVAVTISGRATANAMALIHEKNLSAEIAYGTVASTSRQRTYRSLK